MLVARRLIVTGRVQGVGFRYFTRDAARLDGVRGTVRNLDDGGVEVEVEGDAEAVLRFERTIRRGSDRLARERRVGGRITALWTLS